MNVRYLALAALLIVVAVATLLIAYARPAPPVPTPVPGTSIPLPYSYLIDVAGWYEITENERVVASPFDLSIKMKALPEKIGKWSGTPYDFGPAINEWFENPDLALSDIYRDDKGHQVWFSTFGSRGRKSYFLFEHTPITSYPAAGWTLVESRVVPISIGARALYVQKATLTKDSERRSVFYWYLWSDFQRDPEKGVLTIRLHVPVTSTDEDAVTAGADFLRALFPQVITWRRF
jgi:EpsI family protein